MNEKLIYNQIYEYAYPISGPQDRKHFIGDKNNNTCIFCGKVKGEVSFKKEAHVIPAALGNKSLFNYNECDTCNEDIFSLHENELVNYLQLERIIMRGKPRKGTPKYKPSNSNSFITSKPDTNRVSIHVDENEQVFEIIDQGDNIMTLKCNNLPPYSLAEICKELVHMAWSVLPENLIKRLPYLYDWIKGDIKILPLYLDSAFIPGGGMANVILEIFESNCEQSDNYPILIRFTYGHKVLSFYLPKNENISIAPKVFLYLGNIPEGTRVDGTQKTIQSEERIQPEDCTFTMKYSRKDESNGET